MITNLIIRLVSLAICLCLLIGGAMISFTLTKENEELHADIADIVETPLIPEPETSSTEDSSEEEIPSEDETPSEDEIPSGDKTPSEDETPSGDETLQE